MIPTIATRGATNIPTYPLPEPDPHPAFFEKRVYQGSSGKVYPLAFYTRVSDHKVEQPWDLWILENDFVRVEMLPELGGRIWRGLDKTNNYDFFYHQPVVKPALVGLAGPWLSGGVEFNWPQHHRPATYLPTDVALEIHDDGSKTLWMSDHDPMVHLKGMHGVCIRPGSSTVELKVRLYNRTPHKHTFLWWANVAALVHDQYQSFFPPDVRYVADHAVRAMSSFPIARNHYYGVDYRPGTDLAWYKNIPVPTSYMITRTDYDFFGGFDHKAGGGFVHIANRHVSPGKKQWTWGNHDFGWAWDRELTDPDADGWHPPYVELMAGVYTDNQPDFSYLLPYETKTFTQVWWPVQTIGAIHNANREYAVNLHVEGGRAKVGLCASSAQHHTHLRVTAGGQVVYDEHHPVAPGMPVQVECNIAAGCPAHDITVEVVRGGVVRLAYTPPREDLDVPTPTLATEPPHPQELASNDELYLTGEHLEQYRHPTRDPDRYWLHALEKDPGDVRCNTGLGRRYLTRGILEKAETHLRTAVQRARRRHPNPEEGEPVYFLGLALKLQDKLDEAYALLFKSTWNYAWRAPGYYQVATIDARRGDFEQALEHAIAAQQTNAQHSHARNLQAAMLRKRNRPAEALAVVDATLAEDKLDHYAAFERVLILQTAGQSEEADAAIKHWRGTTNHRIPTLLDLAFDYADAGLFDEALAVLNEGLHHNAASLLYAQARICDRAGKPADAQQAREQAMKADSRWFFPDRLDEELALRDAITHSPTDAIAANALGNLLFDKRRYDEAITAWEQAVSRDASMAAAHRNLGIAYFNVKQDSGAAQQAYAKAFELAPDDAQVLFEYDQLLKRVGQPTGERLARLEAHMPLVESRDDLSIEYVTLLNLAGRHTEAAHALSKRRFHPWEGGEGKAMAQHVAAHLALSRSALRDDANRARELAEKALTSPENLGEAKHLLANLAEIHYHLGLAHRACNEHDKATESLERAAASGGDFVEMAVTDYSARSYYKGLALRLLGRDADAQQTFQGMLEFGQKLCTTEARIDYFATSLPDLLVFNDDLQKRREIEGTLLQALAQVGLRNRDAANELLKNVIAEDPSNAIARMFLQEADVEGSVLW